MKKILSFFCILFTSNLFAQTYYYKLQRITREGNVSTNVSGGQFVSFANKKQTCFESDYEGYSVGNGKLEFDECEDGWDVYYGTSYWGQKTSFLFNFDKSSLKVRTADGDIYEYHRETRPKDITTCSLIRGKSEDEGISGTVYVPIPQPIVPNGSSDPQKRSIPDGRRQKEQPVRHECSVCHGEKTIVKDFHVGGFGTSNQDVKEYCSRCGKYFFRSTGHRHITCPECHGRGYWTSN